MLVLKHQNDDGYVIRNDSASKKRVAFCKTLCGFLSQSLLLSANCRVLLFCISQRSRSHRKTSSCAVLDLTSFTQLFFSQRYTSLPTSQLILEVRFNISQVHSCSSASTPVSLEEPGKCMKH